MPKFDRQSLENLENLCRIKCTLSEKEVLLSSLSEILEYIEQLNQVDTDNISSINNISQEMQPNLLREDEVEQTLSTDLFLSNAPDQVAGMIKVPPVLKSL